MCLNPGTVGPGDKSRHAPPEEAFSYTSSGFLRFLSGPLYDYKSRRNPFFPLILVTPDFFCRGRRRAQPLRQIWKLI